MNRFTFALAVAVIYLLGSGEFTVAQHKDHDANAKQTTKVSSVYTCPMHPEVVSDKPGKCPKCEMNLVLKETGKSNAGKPPAPSENIAKAKSLLIEAKKALMKEGNYSCCIEDACDECALAHDNCPCASNLKAGKDVCTQCYGGWQRGEGAVEGVKAKDVKLGHGHKH